MSSHPIGRPDRAVANDPAHRHRQVALRHLVTLRTAYHYHPGILDHDKSLRKRTARVKTNTSSSAKRPRTKRKAALLSQRPKQKPPHPLTRTKPPHDGDEPSQRPRKDHSSSALGVSTGHHHSRDPRRCRKARCSVRSGYESCRRG